MDKTSMDHDQRATEMTIRLKKEFYIIAAQSKTFVKRTPRIDKLDDLHEKLHEACTLLHIMTDVLIGHGRKAIDTFENGNYDEPDKDRIIEKLQDITITEIPCIVKEAVMKSIY
jgi:hypothetical protein